MLHTVKQCAHSFVGSGSLQYCLHCTAQINILGIVELFCKRCGKQVKILDGGLIVSHYDWKTKNCKKRRNNVNS